MDKIYTEYQSLASVTSSTANADGCVSVMGRMDEQECCDPVRLLHGSIGIYTELGELVDSIRGDAGAVNFKEEVGDLMWYVSEFCSGMSVRFSDLIPDEEFVTNAINYFRRMSQGAGVETEHVAFVSSIILDMLSKSANMADALKRLVFYGAAFDADRCKMYLLEIVLDAEALAVAHGVSLSECLESNISKLRARYSSKFSQHEALNRDLASEGRALGSATEDK